MAGYGFWIGRIYRIQVRSTDGRILSIRLWSLFGIRRKRLAQKFNDLLNTLYWYYFTDITAHYISLLENDFDFSLADVGLSPDGIADKKLGRIAWEQAAVKPYYTYFALYDAGDGRRYRTFEYGMAWNAAILYAVVHHAVNRRLACRIKK